MTINAILFVGLGGAGGAILRYWISSYFTVQQDSFPWATFIANLSGAVLIGIAYLLIIERPFANPAMSESLRQLLMIGFLGGLTTYSSFSLESVQLLMHGHYQTACIYMLATLFACLALTSLTIMLGKAFL